MTAAFSNKKKSEKFSERMAKKTKLSEAEIDRLVHIFMQMTVSSELRYWQGHSSEGNNSGFSSFSKQNEQEDLPCFPQ